LSFFQHRHEINPFQKNVQSARVVDYNRRERLPLRKRAVRIADIVDTALDQDEDEIVGLSERKPITGEIGSS
jgi:hypothetical protein